MSAYAEFCYSKLKFSNDTDMREKSREGKGDFCLVGFSLFSEMTLLFFISLVYKLDLEFKYY